jgi:hypothetical protein
MENQVFVRMYLRHAIPMVIAIMLSIAVAGWIDWKPLGPILLMGIIFGGLVGIIQHTYQAGFKDGSEAKHQADEPTE